MSDQEEYYDYEYDSDDQDDSPSDESPPPRRSSQDRRHRSRSRSQDRKSQDRRSQDRRHRWHRSRERRSRSPLLGSNERKRSPTPGINKDPEVTLCSIHKNDLRVDSCKACKTCSHLLRKEVADDLVKKAPEPQPPSIPNAKERLLNKRSDEPDPTLTFSEEELSLAEMLYSQVHFQIDLYSLFYLSKGHFKRAHFEDLVRKFLYLPKEQNALLGKNLETEDLFRQYEYDKRYQHIFRYMSQVVTAGVYILAY